LKFLIKWHWNKYLNAEKMCFKNELCEKFMKNIKENFDSLIGVIRSNGSFKEENRLT
jgi:hypothetical protein